MTRSSTWCAFNRAFRDDRLGGKLSQPQRESGAPAHRRTQPGSDHSVIARRLWSRIAPLALFMFELGPLPWGGV
jgi:hypothetical protein